MSIIKKGSLNRVTFRSKSPRSKFKQIFVLSLILIGLFFGVNQIFGYFDHVFYDSFDDVSFSELHWNNLSTNGSSFCVYNSRLIPDNYGNGSEWKGPKWVKNVNNAGNFKLEINPYFFDSHPNGSGIGGFVVGLYSGYNMTGDSIFEVQWHDTSSIEAQGCITFRINDLVKIRSVNQSYKDWYYISEYFKVIRKKVDDIQFQTNYRGNISELYSTKSGPKIRIKSIMIQALKFGNETEISTSLNSFSFDYDVYATVSSYSYISWDDRKEQGFARMWFKIYEPNTYYVKIEYRVAFSTNYKVIHWMSHNYTAGLHRIDENFSAEKGQLIVMKFILYKADKISVLNSITKVTLLQS
jgi:hypothetical protein